MSEIYWISRLDYINSLVVALSIIFGVIAAMGLFAYFAYEDDDKDKNDEYKKIYRKIYRRSLMIFIPSIIIVIFIPTTKQAYMIWGVGGTIDYIRSNETIQKLPDKTIQCLDKFIDEYLEEEPSSTE